MSGPKQFDYPALYETASDLSDQSQQLFLNLIRAEYGLLVLTAVLSLNWAYQNTMAVLYAITLVGAVSVLIARNAWKPEQDWYRGRALAESIKTSSWRYCMRATPFADAPSRTIPTAAFRSLLLDILKTNRFIGDRMPPDSAAREPIPDSMMEVRQLLLKDRKSYYLTHRIKEQRAWYARKAAFNKRASRVWFWLGVGAYGIAIVLAITRVSFSTWSIWPIEPLVVIAASIVGWTQVKKFNELAASYLLTAHEIGLLGGKLEIVDDEEDFSMFINEAELAFSREHTQWVARQNNQ